MIGSVEVLEPSSASGARCGSISLNTSALTVGSSNTASITRSAPAASAASAVARDPGEQRVVLPPAVERPLATAFSTSFCEYSLPCSAAPGETSLSTTSMPGLRAHVGDRGAHHARAEHDDLLRGERLDPLGPAAVTVDALQVEEERLDHVLRDLAGHQVDEVAALDLDRVVEVDLGALDRRGHDVVRSRVVRALELLAQVGRERRQVLRELGVRRRAAGDLVALGVPRLDRRIGVGLDPRLGGRHQLLARRDDLVDDARAPSPWRDGGAGPEAAATSARWRCPSMRTVRTTPPAPGSRPSWTSGKPSWTFGSSSAIAVVAGQADLEAAAERGAVDRGDDRLAERLQAAQHAPCPRVRTRRSPRPASLVACAGR